MPDRKKKNPMGKMLMILLILINCSVTNGQNKNYLLATADSLYHLSEFEKSAVKYEAYLSLSMEKVEASVCYKTAVSYSKTGNANKAIDWLQQSLNKGYDDEYLSDIRFDLNFYPIHHTQSWKRFFESNTAKFVEEAQQINHPQLRQELLQLWQSDQYYRRLIFGRYNGRPPNEVGKVTEAVDRFNAQRLEQIVDEIGWPTHSKVGRDGAHAAWNIIQHAVFNPPLMKRCLNEMEIALHKNEVDGIDYAYLYDRFNAVCSLGKQDYGIVRNVPIRAEHLVNQRRKEMGFQITLDEYLGSYMPKTKEACKQKELELQEKYHTNLEKGKALLAEGQFEEAEKYYKAVMTCNGYIKTEDIYASAKIKSLLNTRRSKFQAIRYIRSLTARGFNDIERLNKDAAFDSIRKEAAYLEIVEIIKKYNLVNSN